MNKTFEIVEAYTGNREIKAYEDGDCIIANESIYILKGETEQ